MPAIYRDDLVEIDDTSGDSYLTAPDVALLGTIPYIDLDVSSMPNTYATSRYETGVGLMGSLATLVGGGGAFTRLFANGDDIAPAPTYANLLDFKSALVCRAFRGALWMTDVRLYHDGQRSLGASYRWGVQVGSTPIRPGAIVPMVPPRLACHKGAGRVGPNRDRPDFVPAAGGYLATIRFDFKLRGFADWAQWVFTRHRAPWAWTQLDCGLQLDPSTGSGQLSLIPSGAYIPSSFPYVGWSQVQPGIHDMLGNPRRDIEAFVETGACLPSLPRVVGPPIVRAF